MNSGMEETDQCSEANGQISTNLYNLQNKTDQYPDDRTNVSLKV